MANFKTTKWKKRALTAFSVALAASLSLGALAACATTPDTPEDEDTAALPTDTQLLKNGDFEFYTEATVKENLKKTTIISSPNNWSFSSGSPSSETRSGIINTADWAYFTRPGSYAFSTYTKNDKEVTTFRDIAEAVAHWEDDSVNAYDRLKFLDLYEDEIDDLASSSKEATMLSKYNYSIDFEDVENLDEEVKNLGLHAGADADKTGLLMIHNDRTSDGVRGTAQYYTSSTTITLSAGTAARVSVWVRTDSLVHYEDTDLTARGGAYIGITNTVGGSTLDQMQIYNISTEGAWKNYTVYVRASTFATTTFRVVLGLGQGSSDDRYYNVDGYAFFDDVECEVLPAETFETEAAKEDVVNCSIDSVKEEKQFPVDEPAYASSNTFALDLYAGFEAGAELLSPDDVSIGLTEQTSGSRTYTSADIDGSLGESEEDFARVTTVSEIASSANPKLQNVYENDFKDKFPFDSQELIMLMSAKGAAYTATLKTVTLGANERALVSFFVKTNEIGNGLSGATALVVDGENKTSISAFDSTKIASVDIDSESDDDAKKDIYKGWVQCFFFLQNDGEESRDYHIELSYGPTTIVGTARSSFGAGYAAFANFETKVLSKTEYNYATTGDRAKKVSLTGGVEESKRFDSVSGADEKTIEEGPALPANFRGVLGGSDFVLNNETAVPNVKPESVDTGLLNAKYADRYFASEAEWKSLLDGAANGAQNGAEWWNELFGNARQPLVILNREAAAYGYFAETATLNSASYQRISLRVKASAGAKAYIYLTDVSSAEQIGKLLSPNIPGYTYWYDDEGNIVSKDPSDEDFDKKTDILYELQPNGLYRKLDDPYDNYYANLNNYEEDDDGNLVTKEGTIAFYKDGGAYYAYYDEDKDEYSCPVANLSKEGLRYPEYTDKTFPVSQIVVTGTGKWETVNFYLHGGNESKEYRLEVWSGSRDGSVTNPANSYVFFDNYASASYSNYTTLLGETVSEIKDRLNEGKQIGEEGFLGEEDNLPEEYALYYTFTFYDSPSYLRYDESADEESLGNPYGSYKQSSHDEQLVYLYYESGGEDSVKNYSLFLDYAATDVTVAADDLTPDDDTDTDTGSDAETNPTNIWLLLSSGILAIVLVFAIAVVVIRRLVKRFGKSAKIKPAKDKRIRPSARKGDEA